MQYWLCDWMAGKSQKNGGQDMSEGVKQEIQQQDDRNTIPGGVGKVC